MENRYVLITPARNEEAYIEKTIQSVISQSILPIKWIIVSDSSKDNTEEIVNKYVSNYDFIQLMRVVTDKKRIFSSKVEAFSVGYKKLRNLDFQFIGNLDADISFESHYFKFLLEKLNQNAKLGITGGLIMDKLSDGFHFRRYDREGHVAGAVQLFRRKTYEQIGGYIPIKRGGIDSAALIMARMHGWEIKTFAELKVLHHRRTGENQGNRIVASFNDGLKEYSHRYHPLFEIAKFFYRISEKPFILSSFSRICGYCLAVLRREEQCLPDDVVKFLRKEQLQRIVTLFSGK